MEMSCSTAEVIWPCALIASVTVLLAEPYVAAVTAVLAIENWVPVSVRPVPAVYRVESLTCTKVIAVVPKVIVPEVLQTYV